jgi:hypothetical protein
MNVTYKACECMSEIMSVQFEQDDKQVYIAIYRHNYLGLSFFGRLKYIWTILTTGKQYADEIILNYQKANELGKLLINYTQEELDRDNIHLL